MSLEQSANEMHESFNDSYQRVMSSEEQFFETFYQKFIESSDSIKQLFEDVDMAVQKQMLNDSFMYLISFSKPNDVIERLAIKHAGVKGIDSEMYDSWLTSIVDAVKVHDPKFSVEVERAWRFVLDPGINYMKEHGV